MADSIKAATVEMAMLALNEEAKPAGGIVALVNIKQSDYCKRITKIKFTYNGFTGFFILHENNSAESLQSEASAAIVDAITRGLK